MKQLYTFLFVCSICFTNAQTLTQSFNEPVIGDIDKNYKLDTVAYPAGLPISVTGSTSVWDFSKASGIFPMVVDSFISPAAAAGASAYPTASYAQHRDILNTFYKSTTSPSQTELLGAYSPSLTLTFTNSAIIAGYPVNYGYNLTDPVSGTFKYNTTNGACNGNITISADGLGSVKLPNGSTIPNVLRLKSVEILTLSIGVLPFGSFNQTIYNYYEPNKKFPILSLNYTKYQLIAGTPTITALVYGNSSYFPIVGLNEIAGNSALWQVYPNPCHDVLQLQSITSLVPSEYKIYAINGALLRSGTVQSDIQVADLIPGMYYLELKSGETIVRKKFMKE